MHSRFQIPRRSITQAAGAAQAHPTTVTRWQHLWPWTPSPPKNLTTPFTHLLPALPRAQPAHSHLVPPSAYSCSRTLPAGCMLREPSTAPGAACRAGRRMWLATVPCRHCVLHKDLVAHAYRRPCARDSRPRRARPARMATREGQPRRLRPPRPLPDVLGAQ